MDHFLSYSSFFSYIVYILRRFTSVSIFILESVLRLFLYILYVLDSLSEPLRFYSTFGTVATVVHIDGTHPYSLHNIGLQS
jgi:hypothetical protein